MKANKTDLHKSGRPLSQEEFINKIKTDDEFTKKWGELGKIYGKQWRDWGGPKWVQPNPNKGYLAKHFKKENGIDQIQNSINLLKTDPDSRRNIVSAWNPSDLDQMTLPPCHYGFQVYTRELSLEERIEISTFWHKDEVRKQLEDSITGTTEKYVLDKLEKQGIPTRAISLMWNQRSVDTFLGLPFNIASYGLLLEIIAKEVNMVPDELIGNLGDVHLYKNHIEQAKEQIGRELSLGERIELIQPTGMDALIPEARDKWMEDNNIPTRTREPMKLPTLGELPDYLCMKDNWECYEPSDFTLENYEPHPTIKAPLNN